MTSVLGSFTINKPYYFKLQCFQLNKRLFGLRKKVEQELEKVKLEALWWDGGWYKTKEKRKDRRSSHRLRRGVTQPGQCLGVSIDIVQVLMMAFLPPINLEWNFWLKQSISIRTCRKRVRPSIGCRIVGIRGRPQWEKSWSLEWLCVLIWAWPGLRLQGQWTHETLAKPLTQMGQAQEEWLYPVWD